MVNKLMLINGLFEPEHLILIIVVIVLFFGGKKIPEMMRGLGSGVREFNNAKNGIKNDLNNAASTSDQKPAQQQQSSITDLEHEPVKN